MLYDLLCIVPVQKTTDDTSKIKKQILEIIEKQKGKVIKEEDLGKKNFFFPIKSFREGEYLSFKFEALAEKINEINKELRFNSSILRHLIIKID